MNNGQFRSGFCKPHFFPRTGAQLSHWTMSENLTGAGPHHRPLHRIFDIAYELGCKTISVQRIDDSADFEGSFPDVYAYCQEAKDAARITHVDQICFLRAERDEVAVNFPDHVNGKNLIGMAIVIQMQFTRQTPQYPSGELLSFVYEAIIRPSKGNRKWDGDIFAPPVIGASHCTYLCRPYTFRVAKKKITLTGCFFQGSDEFEAACVQCGLRTGFRYFDKDISYVAMNAAVQKLRTLSGNGGLFDPAKGYRIGEVVSLIREANLDFQILDCKDKDTRDVNPYEWAYLAAKCGMAVCLMFSPSSAEGDDDIVAHVLPVVGYTTNYDEWRPVAHSFYEGDTGLNLYQGGGGYASTAHWVPHLLVHDNILGPFHCLRERDLIKVDVSHGCRGQADLCEAEITMRMRYVVAILPKGMTTMEPYVAQDIAYRILKLRWNNLKKHAPTRWLMRFEQPNGPLNSYKTCVFRTRLVQREDYIRHIKDTKDYYRKSSKLSDANADYLRNHWPDRFWMVEYTCPEVYSVVRAKFGEVLLKCDVPKGIQDQHSTSDWPDILVGIRHFDKLMLAKRETCRLGFTSHTSCFCDPAASF